METLNHKDDVYKSIWYSQTYGTVLLSTCLIFVRFDESAESPGPRYIASLTNIDKISELVHHEWLQTWKLYSQYNMYILHDVHVHATWHDPITNLIEAVCLRRDWWVVSEGESPWQPRQWPYMYPPCIAHVHMHVWFSLDVLWSAATATTNQIDQTTLRKGLSVGTRQIIKYVHVYVFRMQWGTISAPLLSPWGGLPWLQGSHHTLPVHWADLHRINIHTLYGSQGPWFDISQYSIWCMVSLVTDTW